MERIDRLDEKISIVERVERAPTNEELTKKLNEVIDVLNTVLKLIVDYMVEKKEMS